MLVRATKKNGRARCCFVAQGTTLVLESAITDQPYTASLVFSSCAPCTRIPMSKPIVETCLQGAETISLVVRHLRTIPFFPICGTSESRRFSSSDSSEITSYIVLAIVKRVRNERMVCRRMEISLSRKFPRILPFSNCHRLVMHGIFAREGTMV